MFTTSFHKYCYSAILISNPAERWQKVHMKMARLVTGKCSRQQARSRTLDIEAGSGIPLFTGRDRKQSGLPSGGDTGRDGNQVWGAWDKLCPAMFWLPGHGVMEPLPSSAFADAAPSARTLLFSWCLQISWNNLKIVMLCHQQKIFTTYQKTFHFSSSIFVFLPPSLPSLLSSQIIFR